MKYYRLKTLNPYYNLAVEEYLLDGECDEVIMLWQNEPSVVVGINQNIKAEVDTAALLARGIHPVRRITGGGAVYHDVGNLNYTFIGESEGIDFAKFSRPIIDALASLGVTVTLSGRNDLCLPDGRKISGGAECKRGKRVLHHGTLLFDADLSVLGEVLTPSPEKLAAKAIKSTPSRVGNLKEMLPELNSIEELIQKIEEFIIESFAAECCEVPENKKIDELTLRNSSAAWLYPDRGISSSLTVKKTVRYPFGTLSVELEFKGDVLTEIKLGGDFFGIKDIGELLLLLRQKSLPEIKKILIETDVSLYIHGMSGEELYSLISE